MKVAENIYQLALKPFKNRTSQITQELRQISKARDSSARIFGYLETATWATRRFGDFLDDLNDDDDLLKISGSVIFLTQQVDFAVKQLMLFHQKGPEPLLVLSIVDRLNEISAELETVQNYVLLLERHYRSI